MPLRRDPVNVNVQIDWRGDAVTRRIRAGIRTGMTKQAQGAVLFARELVNKDTEALMDAITFTLQRARGVSYSLQFGVFDDPGNRPRVKAYGNLGTQGMEGPTQERVEMPQDYAFWQEVHPLYGNPYIRPAVDVFFSDSNLFLAIAGAIFYQRAGFGTDPLVDFETDQTPTGLDQPMHGITK